MKKLLLVLFFSVSITWANNPPMWSQKGHRVIGEVAQKHLNRKAKKAIKNLLDGRSLASVSNFGDEIKADTTYRKFSAWHYVNIPPGKKYGEIKPNKNGDLVVGIETCISVIKSKTSTKSEKAFYLKMLVHLIGDLHQPMHTGRFEDRGGNDIKVEWFNKPSNLHRVWDQDLIENYGMSYSELTNSLPIVTTKEKSAIRKGDILQWVEESQQLVNTIYDSVESGDKLFYRYEYEWWPTVEKQLQKGGIRLAKVLNNLF